jgi:hypothetical protein
MIVQLIVLFLFNLHGNSSLPVEIFEVKRPDGKIEIFTTNKEYRPYTLEINWQLKNIDAPTKKL